MKKSGLKSLVIKNNYGTIVGICDLKVADEAYLSLLIFWKNTIRMEWL